MKSPTMSVSSSFILRLEDGLDEKMVLISSDPHHSIAINKRVQVLILGCYDCLDRRLAHG